MIDSWLRSSLLVLVLFLSGAVLAEGFVIYSSWQLEWRARTEAVRTTESLDVNAIVKQARVLGQDWYRVVAKVDSESGEYLMLDAMAKDWDVWYLSSSDDSWVSNGSLANNPQAPMEADTVAPVSLVVEPLFSDDGDSSDHTLAPSTATPTKPDEPQVVAEIETDTSEPDVTTPSSVEEEDLPIEPEGNNASVAEGEELPIEPEEDLVASSDSAGDSTLSVESTLREVETIQRQAQDLISNWVQRENPTTYVLPTESDSELGENQNMDPSRETWFNELRVPERRRR
ncbi:MAG: hypothetical protein F4X44_11130 [Gammaproteobacteria bacterium]|nr:hypothetical protein [Gammaproteobacteria bacterium]MYD81150.1 hypothetical protein [Gammaproteobacteria bacterium]